MSTRRFIPPERVIILLSFLSHSDRDFSHRLDVAGVGGLAEQAAAETDGVPDRLERLGGHLLGHQADHGAGRPIIGDDVVAVHGDPGLRWG